MKISIRVRITNQLSVFTADMMAITIGLQWVEDVLLHRVVFYVDSEAVLLSVKFMASIRKDLVLEIHQSLFRLHRVGKNIRF